MWTSPAAARAGERAAVVLLHSSAASARQWDALAAALRPHAEVHAVDLHGHGATPAWPAERPFALADDAALVAPVLARVGAAHLVGHSYGGAVALEVAARHPGRVLSVVAYEPVLFRLLFDDAASGAALRDVLTLASAMRARLAHADAAAAARHFIDFWAGDGAWEATPASRRDAIAARMPSVLRHFQALFAQAPVPAPALPTLCLSGALTVPATARIAGLLRTRLPAAEHAVLPGMAHLGPVTHADVVNRRIVGFLRRQPTWRGEPPSRITRGACA